MGFTLNQNRCSAAEGAYDAPPDSLVGWEGKGIPFGWLRSTVVEHRSLAGELPLSCARPAADG